MQTYLYLLTILTYIVAGLMAFGPTLMGLVWLLAPLAAFMIWALWTAARAWRDTTARGIAPDDPRFLAVTLAHLLTRCGVPCTGPDDEPRA